MLCALLILDQIHPHLDLQKHYVAWLVKRLSVSSSWHIHPVLHSGLRSSDELTRRMGPQSQTWRLDGKCFPASSVTANLDSLYEGSTTYLLPVVCNACIKL